MQKCLASRALKAVEMPEGSLCGHTHHRSLITTDLEPLARGLSPDGELGAEAVYRDGRMTASYVHFYFPSNPRAIIALFAPCNAFSSDERASVYRTAAEKRDMRHFNGGTVPTQLLSRLLEAAHRAPSAGLM